MKLIVGLGNPGRRYANTRHNVGFEVVAELAAKYGTGKPRTKHQAEMIDASISGESIVLMCPQTFMNNSGQSVQPAVDFFKLNVETDLLVICDDFHLPVGKLRFRGKGSSGGQKGLDHILRRLGSDQFPRLRIGIGPPAEGWEIPDFVLSKFRKEERVLIDEMIVSAAVGAADWVKEGVEFCMNRYNGA